MQVNDLCPPHKIWLVERHAIMNSQSWSILSPRVPPINSYSTLCLSESVSEGYSKVMLLKQLHQIVYSVYKRHQIFHLSAVSFFSHKETEGKEYNVEA